MKRNSVLIILLSNCIFVNLQETFLDRRFLPLLRFGLRTSHALVKPKTFELGIIRAMKRKKVQQQFSDNFTFFCDVNGVSARSEIVPTSVHKLRPGDLDIIAGVGDSATVGTGTSLDAFGFYDNTKTALPAGAFATSAPQFVVEGKGVAWSIGGQKTWRQFLTIPNILKEFNPKIYGFSLMEEKNSFMKSAKFNVAENGALASDMVHQAKNLVKRMRSDSNVDIKQHWKLVTYMIGGNDFCSDICFHKNQTEVIENAAKSLQLTLKVLRENLPRTIVNVALPPNPENILRLSNKPRECVAFHYYECTCLMSLTHIKNRLKTLKTIERWKRRVEEVVKLPEFHNRNDFEVNLIPFLDKSDTPKTSNGMSDYRYMSSDCFHLSQLGHARAANAYWNAMLTPEDQRKRQWEKEFESFSCPTEENPFLRTTKN